MSPDFKMGQELFWETAKVELKKPKEKI